MKRLNEKLYGIAIFGVACYAIRARLNVSMDSTYLIIFFIIGSILILAFGDITIGSKK